MSSRSTLVVSLLVVAGCGGDDAPPAPQLRGSAPAAPSRALLIAGDRAYLDTEAFAIGDPDAIQPVASWGAQGALIGVDGERAWFVDGPRLLGRALADLGGAPLVRELGIAPPFVAVGGDRIHAIVPPRLAVATLSAEPVVPLGWIAEPEPTLVAGTADGVLVGSAGGLDRLDVSDPRRPRRVDRVPLLGAVRWLAVTPTGLDGGSDGFGTAIHVHDGMPLFRIPRLGGGELGAPIESENKSGQALATPCATDGVVAVGCTTDAVQLLTLDADQIVERRELSLDGGASLAALRDGTAFVVGGGQLRAVTP
jgi:hypothetical protein